MRNLTATSSRRAVVVAMFNGNGNGNATGKPCAACVGRADNKQPVG